MTCPECAGDIPPGSNVCRFCGRVNDYEPSQADPWNDPSADLDGDCDCRPMSEAELADFKADLVRGLGIGIGVMLFRRAARAPDPAPGPQSLGGGAGAAGAGAEPPADPWLRLRWYAAVVIPSDLTARDDLEELRKALRDTQHAPMPAWPEGEDFRLACRQAVLAWRCVERTHRLSIPKAGAALDRACAILERLEGKRPVPPADLKYRPPAGCSCGGSQPTWNFHSPTSCGNR